MSVDLQPRAAIDAELAAEELSEWREGTADRFLEHLTNALDWLERFPYSAEKYETVGPAFGELRHYLIPRDYGYVIFYRPTTDGIAVVRILHGSRNFPAIFGPET